VLSPVGMLPAALLGIDPRAVLAGAAAVDARGGNADPAANPALALALVHQAALAAGRPAAVCLPYADALQPFALWWEQLLAESMGKKGPAGPVGITPVPGVGPSDQHSLLQGLIEGPDHHLTVFIECADRAKDALAVPRKEDALCVGSGKRFGEILAAEREATELALVEAGRPSITIRVPDASPRSVGALFFLYELAVLFWGRLAGVDPFGQPSVERIKVLTKASLTGSPADAVEALAKHRATPRRTAR
jgi:glucose-6-phosphate isomerase